MSYLKERLKHAVRFRHKRGFGVHSPFMFDLILNVIRDRHKQFSYPETLEKTFGLSHREHKEFRMVSRLIRFLEVRRLVCFGLRGEILSIYLNDIDPEVVISNNVSGFLPEADFVYVGRGAREWMKGVDIMKLQEGKNRCVVISDIYKNGFNALLWRQMKERSTVTVDMMWYGVLFFDAKLQYGRYNLII